MASPSRLFRRNILKMIAQAARENLKGADLQDRHAGSSTIGQQLRTYILLYLKYVTRFISTIVNFQIISKLLNIGQEYYCAQSTF
jgi:hypothetical protein